jgi:hypothetical protein
MHPIQVTMPKEFFQELERMRRKKMTAPVLDVRAAVQWVGWKEILRQTGVEDLAAQMTEEQQKDLIGRIGLQNLVNRLSDEQRQELQRLLVQSPPQGRGRKRT